MYARALTFSSIIGVVCCAAQGAAAIAPPPPLLLSPDIPFKLALKGAQAAFEACESRTFGVAVGVFDLDNHARVVLVGDRTPIYAFAAMKEYASIALAKNFSADAVPIVKAGVLVGVISVSGLSHSGETTDETCAVAGRDAIQAGF